jgi:hypothetical protein
MFDDRLGPVHHQAKFTNYLMIADTLEDEPGPRIETSLSIFIFWPVGQDRRYESKRSFT